MKSPMTKEKLERYRVLAAEIADIENKLSAAENEELTWGLVQSAAEFPYKQHNVIVTGHTGLTRNIPYYRARLVEKMEERDEIERFIASVDDSVMWRVLNYRYIEGKTEAETAELVGYHEKSVGRAISNYLEKLSKDVT